MPRVFRLDTIAEATAAVAYFNAFHDGFIRRLRLVSFDRFEDRDTQHTAGRLDLTVRFAHWNYDFAHGARPAAQEVEAGFRHVRDLTIRFGGRETDWSIKRMEVAPATRPRTHPAEPPEPCVRVVLVQPRLLDWREWVDHEDIVFTCTGGRVRELPLRRARTGGTAR